MTSNAVVSLYLFLLPDSRRRSQSIVPEAGRPIPLALGTSVREQR
jgi:hypothetical protein